MAKKRQYLWCLIELPNGKREWYCVSKVLRKALLWEKNRLHNQYWRNTLIGSYLNVARTRYHRNRAIITVGRWFGWRFCITRLATGTGCGINSSQLVSWKIFQLRITIWSTITLGITRSWFIMRCGIGEESSLENFKRRSPTWKNDCKEFMEK